MKKIILVILSILLFIMLAVSSCTEKTQSTTPAQSIPEPVYSDPVKIDTGYISGTVLGDPDNKVHVYRGIPYAAPPTGDLRWKAPEPAAAWNGIRECTVFSNASPQVAQFLNPIPSSEDCLYLNVMTPAKLTTDKLPVMVYFHGGAYYSGHSNMPNCMSLALPEQGIVQVNVNTRIGVIGLLAEPQLSKESANGVSGNYMFLDMIASLNWVQKNVTAFGGDPGNVTIFGESGGSWKVIDLIASPLAKGLFQKAIGESGTPWGTTFAQPLTLKESEARGEALFERLGVKTLEEARSLPWEKIVDADAAIAQEAGLVWGNNDLTVDGWFMPKMPADIFANGQQNAVSMIMGGNFGELTTPSFIFMPEIIPTYVDMFAAADKVGAKSYAYIFNQVPAGWRAAGAVACHAMELNYVFNVINNPIEWAFLAFLAAPPGVTLPDPGVSEADARVSEAMIKMWTQFAKTGNPSVPGLPEWPAYQAATDQYMYFADPIAVKSGFSNVGQE